MQKQYHQEKKRFQAEKTRKYAEYAGWLRCVMVIPGVEALRKLMMHQFFVGRAGARRSSRVYESEWLRNPGNCCLQGSGEEPIPGLA